MNTYVSPERIGGARQRVLTGAARTTALAARWSRSPIAETRVWAVLLTGLALSVVLGFVAAGVR